MDRHQIVAAFTAVVPDLPGVDRNTLTARAATAWQTHRGDPAAAVRAVVDAAWHTGYRAGATSGHAAATWQFAAAVLARAAPAQPGMTGPTRLLARWLHAARVDPQVLARHLVRHGWRQISTTRGHLHLPADSTGPWPAPTPILLTGPLDAGYPDQVLHAVQTLAAAQRQPPIAVLDHLAPAPAAAAISDPIGLAILRHVYDASRRIAATEPTIHDPGPSRSDYQTGTGDWVTIDAPTAAGRLATATRAGLTGGYRDAYTDATWSALHRVTALIDQDLPESLRAGRIDAVPSTRWATSLAEVITATAQRAAHEQPMLPQGHWTDQPPPVGRVPTFPVLALTDHTPIPPAFAPGPADQRAAAARPARR